jgi:hypothetical protein
MKGRMGFYVRREGVSMMAGVSGARDGKGWAPAVPLEARQVSPFVHRIASLMPRSAPILRCKTAGRFETALLPRSIYKQFSRGVFL